jgi:uncharacterized protein
LLKASWDEDVVQLYRAKYLANYWTGPLAYRFELDWSRRPLAEAFEDVFAAAGTRSLGFDAMLHLGACQSVVPYPWGHPFWKLRIPVLHETGWFDNLGPLQMRDYGALCSRPESGSLQYLDADAIDHMSYHLHDAPITPEHDIYASEETMVRWIPTYVGAALSFFDVFLRGLDEASSVPRVRWYLGHEEWRTSSSWPLPESHKRRLYLGAPERAGVGPEGGILIDSADSRAGTAMWVHDPAELVPSTWTDAYAYLREYPDERQVEQREDVLTFTGEPCSDPIDLAGPASASFHLASSGPSLHIFAKVCDVFPDGVVHVVMCGQRLVRASEYGSPVEIAMGHTAYRVQSGHCLRLQIASSDFPLYLWHPGTDENPWFATAGMANQQRLETGGSRPSYLTLTVCS